MKLRLEKVKKDSRIIGIKIYDENNGFIVITKEQALSLCDVLKAMIKEF